MVAGNSAFYVWIYTFFLVHSFLWNVQNLSPNQTANFYYSLIEWFTYALFEFVD